MALRVSSGSNSDDLDVLHEINVTPLIDVIMCLIIFFLLCGQFAKEEANDQEAAQGKGFARSASRLDTLQPVTGAVPGNTLACRTSR